jgi:uncharacterized protein DUF5670
LTLVPAAGDDHLVSASYGRRTARPLTRVNVVSGVSGTGTAVQSRYLPIGRAGVAGERILMLWLLASILGLLWGVGVYTGHPLGGFIHILLIASLLTLIMALAGGPRSTTPR